MSERQKFWLIIAAFLLIFGLLSSRFQELDQANMQKRMAARRSQVTDRQKSASQKPMRSPLGFGVQQPQTKQKEGLEYFQ